MKFKMLSSTLALSIILAPTSVLPIKFPTKETFKAQSLKVGKAVKTHGITVSKNTLRTLEAIALCGLAFFIGGIGLSASEKLTLNTWESGFEKCERSDHVKGSPEFKGSPEYDLRKTLGSKVLAPFIGIAGLLIIHAITGKLTIDQEEAEAIYPGQPAVKKATDDAAAECAAPSSGCSCC